MAAIYSLFPRVLMGGLGVNTKRISKRLQTHPLLELCWLALPTSKFENTLETDKVISSPACFHMTCLHCPR